MPRNIEIKVRVADLATVEARARDIAQAGPEHLRQHDTFFDAPHGRLKLREFHAPLDDGRTGELIFYQRADLPGLKTSHYRRVPVSESDALREALSAALGTRGEVRKARTVYLAERTRIHLDRVDGLGEFVELEVVLADNDSETGGHAEAERILDALGLREAERLPGAYLDLLAAPA